MHARVLLADLRDDGFLQAASRLADRAADQAALSHPGLAGKLLAELCMTGKEAGLLRRDPVGQATLWNLAAVARLAGNWPRQAPSIAPSGSLTAWNRPVPQPC